MPYVFGTNSASKLATCHPDIQLAANLAIRHSPYDFSIVHGWRSEEQQNALFNAEPPVTKVQWPNSKHNVLGPDGQPLSDAIDFAPYIPGVGIPWSETHIFAAVAGVIMTCARFHNITLRWGGDWDGDGSTKDQSLADWGHIERVA